MKNHLVTTALRQTFNTESNNILLGEWCKIYNESYIEKIELQKDYHWNDRIKFKEDYFKLNEFYETILINLQENLNKFHSVNHSLGYYRIFIGPWLSSFLHNTFDKWENIRLAKKKFNIDTTSIINIKTEDIIPNTFEEYTRLIPTDIWNHYIYSKIIKSYYSTEIKYENLEIDYKFKTNPLLGSFNTNIFEIKNGKKKNSYLSILYNLFNKIFYLLKKNDEILVYKSYLDPATERQIRKKFKQIQSQFVYLFEKNLTLKKLNRNNFCLDFKTNNNFELFILENISEFIPTIYLENYKLFNDQVLNLPFPKKPKIILSSHILNHSLTALYTAKCLEQGSKLFYGQHGGVYGQYAFTWREDHETKICNKYLTWGWSNKNNKNIYPFGIIKNIDKLKYSEENFSKSNNLLLVCRGRSRYEQKLNSSSGTNQFKTYIDDTIKFGSFLKEDIRNNLIVRFHTRKYGWKEEERWKKTFGSNIKLDWGDKPLDPIINSSRIVICSYVGTTYLETLPKNIPTIVYENFNDTLFRDEVLDDLEQLKDANILFKNPHEAAKFINENWDNLKEWWLNEKTQKIISNFCNRYSKNNSNKLSDIINLINREIE